MDPPYRMDPSAGLLSTSPPLVPLPLSSPADLSAPPTKAPTSQKMGFKIVTEGRNKCGTTVSGEPEEMGVGAWIWMILLIVNAVGQIVRLLFTKKTNTGEPMPVTSRAWIAAILVLVVSLLNMWIFYKHAQNCNAWVGFWVTCLTQIVCTGLTCLIAPEVCFDVVTQ